MQIDRKYLWVALAGLTVALVLAVGWLQNGWWSARGAQIALAALIACSSLALCVIRGRKDERSALRHLEKLAGLDWRQWATSLPANPLPSGSEWAPLVGRFRTTLTLAGRKIQELEQALAAWETRALNSESHCEQIRGVLAGFSEPIIAVDGSGELVLANPSAEKLFDIDTPSTSHRAADQLLRCEKLIDLIVESRNHGNETRCTTEIEISDQRGCNHWYSVTASPFATPGSNDGESAQQGTVAVLRDISSQRSTQRRNAEFVSAVSHEMKTPLAGIKAYVELLADGDAEDAPTQKEFLAVINSQANRLQRLVDNLLHLASIEAGVVIVNKQVSSLNELLLEAVEAVEPAAEGKQIVIVSELCEEDLNVVVDREMILQAAANLLSNAVKYTLPGGKIVLRSKLFDDRVEFEVEDTGVGLNRDDCLKVFEKFYRVQKDKEMAVGTGLGLPLAKHIIEDVHRGSLRVESQLGRGSTFRVTLPGSGRMR